MSAKCFFHANLTRDPEVRYTPRGVAVCNIGIAVNHKWKTEEGEDREETSFFDLVAFGRRAEVIGQYIKKGDKIIAWCRPKQESWEDRNTGQKRYAVKFMIEEFDFGAKARGNQGQSDNGDNGGNRRGNWDDKKTARENIRANAAQEPAPLDPADEPPMPSDDDVPF